MPGDLAQTETIRFIAGCRPPIDAYDADIIILSLNRLAETVDAIQSALAQRGIAFHVTVLDQGSMAETVSGLAKRFSKAPNFAFYRAATNLGVAGGRNLATSLGHGRIIIALDNDAVFEQPWVAARALRAFNQKPDLGALGFGILSADGIYPDKFSWGYPAPLLTQFRECFDTTTSVPGTPSGPLPGTWLAAMTQLFFYTWEEYDFCLAAISLNWRVCYDGRLAVIHKVSPTARVPWNAART
jgi:GT2 family glycosyltransferase